MSRRRITESEATAYHEAGHAVVAFEVGRGVQLVTIIPEGDAEGRVRKYRLRGFHPDYETDGRTTRRLEQEIMISLAGGLAEARYKGHRRRLGDEKDLSHALDMASYVTGEPEECEAYIHWLYLRTRNLLEVRWGIVEQFASELLARRRLSGREAKAVWRNAYCKQAGIDPNAVRVSPSASSASRARAAKKGEK
jgi:hypothetical protein